MSSLEGGLCARHHRPGSHSRHMRIHNLSRQHRHSEQQSLKLGVEESITHIELWVKAFNSFDATTSGLHDDGVLHGQLAAGAAAHDENIRKIDLWCHHGCYCLLRDDEGLLDHCPPISIHRIYRFNTSTPLASGMRRKICERR